MSKRVYNVLFLCTANSARSVLAEALMNDPAINRGRFRGFSAGSFPRGSVNPHALALLREQGYPVDGLRSKSWDEFAGPAQPQMDFIFTVCDAAANEPCPLWSGHPATAHWGVPDPAAVDGDDATMHKAFHDTLLKLRRRIESFTALPIDALDPAELTRRLQAIGRQ